MNQLGKILLAGGVCAAAWSMTALASTNLETSSSLAGITVAMNNYYASNEEPEKSLSEAIESINFPEIVSADSGGGEESQAAGWLRRQRRRRDAIAQATRGARLFVTAGKEPGQ